MHTYVFVISAAILAMLATLPVKRFFEKRLDAKMPWEVALRIFTFAGGAGAMFGILLDIHFTGH